VGDLPRPATKLEPIGAGRGHLDGVETLAAHAIRDLGLVEGHRLLGVPVVRIQARQRFTRRADDWPDEFTGARAGFGPPGFVSRLQRGDDGMFSQIQRLRLLRIRENVVELPWLRLGRAGEPPFAHHATLPVTDIAHHRRLPIFCYRIQTLVIHDQRALAQHGVVVRPIAVE
jgi:hypothetical protein